MFGARALSQIEDLRENRHMKIAIRLLPVAALLAISACDTTRPVAVDQALQPDASAATVQRSFAQDIIIDYAGPTDTHAGPGPHPTTETSSYSLLNGGIRWFAGGTVEYQLTASPSAAAANAIAASVQAFDALISARAFVRNDATLQTNPCTDAPNVITWASIDGPGGIIGATRPCYDVRTKELVGFSVMLDSDDAWSTTGAAGTFDVADVATHEFGHAVGLGHVNAPKDGCLTMYRYVIELETQKATLGWGDKLGLKALYANTDVTPGACGS